jgi:hypothetical protein
MKLKELQINEGLVDPAILATLQAIDANGIGYTLHALILAKALMAIQQGYTFSVSNFNAYFNEFSPKLDVLDSVRALSKENAQQLAAFASNHLQAKNAQVASSGSFRSIGEIIAYATKAEAND